MTYSAAADMSAGLIVVTYVYESLSGFLITHPDLVLMTMPFWGTVLASFWMFIVSCL